MEREGRGEKTRLNSELSGQAAASVAVGKSTASEGGDGTSAEGKEGGEGAAAPAPAAPATPQAPAGGIGPAKIQVSGKSKGAKNATPTIAIGEEVTFSASEEGSWTMEGTQDLGSGQTITWTAPDTGGARVLRFEPNLTSPNKHKSTSIGVLIAAPSKLDFKKIGDLPSAGPDMAGVGMQVQVTVGPEDASFEQVSWREKAGPAENVTGYFAAYVATGQSLAHPPNPNWLPMGADNKGIIDNAWTRDKPKLQHADGTKRWWAGSFQWTIPNVYRLKSGQEHVFASVVQTFVMDDAGAITVTKGGASATAKPNGDTQGDIAKFKNVAEAKTYLTPHGRAGAVQAALNYKRSPKADAKSVSFLGAALREFDILLRANVTCNNTHAWTGPDKVTVTANGAKSDLGTVSMNNKKSLPFEFHVNDVMDLGKLETAPITLVAQAKDMTSTNNHSVTLNYPYSASGAFDTEERYSYQTFFR